MRVLFPSNQELESALLDALKELGGIGTVSEMNEKVIQILHLPAEVVELEDESGMGTKLNYCLRWSRTKLKNAKKIEQVKKGTWKLI